MKILIAAIGKAKVGPQQQLYLDYVKRLPWKLECKEFDVKLEGAQRKEREGEHLSTALQNCDIRIALDETGKNLSSREFAEQLRAWQSRGHSSFGFMIGGSDGLSAQALSTAQLVWSLGRVTWPHMLVRALLAEQLYRAHTMLSGHPYHRD